MHAYFLISFPVHIRVEAELQRVTGGENYFFKKLMDRLSGADFILSIFVQTFDAHRFRNY
jgi:hypothetical protein